MRPLKIRTLNNNTKKIKTEALSNSPTTVGLSSERYIDYTNFQDGFVMVYDEERDRYHFVNPDDVLETTLQGETTDKFSQEMFNSIKDTINIDFGEY